MENNPLLIDPKKAQMLLGVGVTKFYVLAKQPNFPKPVYPNGKRPMYLSRELENWVNSLKEANENSIF